MIGGIIAKESAKNEIKLIKKKDVMKNLNKYSDKKLEIKIKISYRLIQNINLHPSIHHPAFWQTVINQRLGHAKALVSDSRF